MTKFIYNNAKNASTSFTPFKLNCGYHLCISNQKDINSCSQSKLTNNLADEFKEFRVIYWENLKYTQDFQKEIYNNGTKPKSYAHNDKIWLNSKYIKIKQNWKLKSKFFRLFWVLYLLKKEVYKLKLLKK